MANDTEDGSLDVNHQENWDALPVPADPGLAWRNRAVEYEKSNEYLGPLKYRRFIAVLAATGSLQFAARQAAVTTHHITRRRERYPEFDTAVLRANNYYCVAVLERAANVRAVDGYLKPVYYQGTLVGYEHRYSDTLMVKLLEGNMPEKYKPRQEVDISGGLAIKVIGGLPEPERLTIDNEVPKAIEHEKV